jgi:hypothetical protein
MAITKNGTRIRAMTIGISSPFFRGTQDRDRI